MYVRCNRQSLSLLMHGLENHTLVPRLHSLAFVTQCRKAMKPGNEAHDTSCNNVVKVLGTQESETKRAPYRKPHENMFSCIIPFTAHSNIIKGVQSLLYVDKSRNIHEFDHTLEPNTFGNGLTGNNAVV